MEICIRCGRNEQEVRLFDGFYINEPVKICEKCSLIDRIPIIKRPSAEQLKDSEKPYDVRSRLIRIAHLSLGEKKEKSIYDEIKALESNPELEQPEDPIFNLIDNFHWAIQTARRRRGLTQKQLAETIAESESAIKMLEKGIMPSNSFNLIRKLEQFLNIALIKRDSFKSIEEKSESPARENTESKTHLATERQISLSPTSFRKEHAEKFTIGDLQKLSKRIEDDLSYVKKTKEEVGKEQVEDFGREDMEKAKKSVYSSYEKVLKTRGKVPTIYDLMKQKEEKDKTSITGKDIEIIESHIDSNEGSADL